MFVPRRVREEDDRRTLFALRPAVAPVKVAVLAVVDLPKFAPFVRRLGEFCPPSSAFFGSLTMAGVRFLLRPLRG